MVLDIPDSHCSLHGCFFFSVSQNSSVRGGVPRRCRAGRSGLLTLRGLECLQQADLVLYDGLANPQLLQHTRATAERTARVGGPGQRHLEQSEINQRLIAAAREGKTVVRLKGGDPFIFGRGSEEAVALAEAGVPFEVVPGITAATGAAVYSGISLTHRDHASAVALITGHEDPTKPESALAYDQLARFRARSCSIWGCTGSSRLPAR